MDINVHQMGPHTVVVINGDIDLYNVSNLKAAIIDAIDDNVNSLIVDMHGIYYMDSSGIGALVAAQKKMRKIRGNFALVNVQEDVMEVIRLASLHHFFNIYKADKNYSNIPVADSIGSTEAPLQKKGKPPAKKMAVEISPPQKEEPAKPQPREDANRPPETIIFKGWVNSDTFRMPADGSPRKQTPDILQRKIESKASAIRLAQLLVLEHFVGSFKNRNWVEFHNYRKRIFANYADIVRKGSAKLTKFDTAQKCTIIYEVKAKDLRSSIISEFEKSKPGI